MQGFGYVSHMGMTAELSVVELNLVLDSESYTAPPDAGSIASGMFISVNKQLPAVPDARCGDTLRLRVSLTGDDGGAIDELGPSNPTIP